MFEKEAKDFVKDYLHDNLILDEDALVLFVTETTKELEAQIEKMKSDVKGNIKWADENKNNQMYCKLNAMFNQWEIKEK